MGIVDNIFDGTATWAEIFEHNIEVVQAKIEFERNNKHDPNNCGRKYCKHGNRHYRKQLVDLRTELTRELELIRAGVTPTDVR